jgi:hypothetical protein
MKGIVNTKHSASQYAHAVRKSHVTVIKFVYTDKVYYKRPISCNTINTIEVLNGNIMNFLFEV